MASLTGGRGEGDDEMISGINVTPLVDIVLVLLIIFMVTATYIVREAIEVDLPRAAHAGEAVGSTLAVVLTREGAIYLDGVMRSDAELAARAREAVARDREARAIISADRGAMHGSVVHVIDVVKGAGGAGTVMAGIADALIATAVGLFVALPAVVMFNLFQRWVRRTTQRSTVLGHAVVAWLRAAPAATTARS